MKAYALIFSIGLGLSLYLFLGNPWLVADYHSDSYSWFVDFSRSIFYPQSAYYAESILLPLIGKMIGASRSVLLYKSLCAVLTIAILPISGVLAQRYFQSFYKALAFVLLFGLSFQYFRFFILGFPDPLTILLLITAVFQRKAIPLFCLLALAMLSHFSMAVIAAVMLVALVSVTSIPIGFSFRKYLAVVATAVLVGKLLLLSWYGVFHYQLQSRLNWALEKGLPFFVERYQADTQGFWLMPGIPFLFLYGLILTYFLLNRQFLLVASAICCLAITYCALFLTVDGLRVFAVIIAAPYAYFLTIFIQSIGGKLEQKHAISILNRP